MENIIIITMSNITMKIKNRKCIICNELFATKQFLQKWCSYDCGAKYAISLSEKLKQNKWKEEKKIMIENLKSLSDYKNDLQKVVNHIARLIDYGQPCIATGSYSGKMSGGHCIGVGANDTIRFNLHNIHIQSFHSNSWKGGDNIRYKEGIRLVYGEAYLDRLNQLKSTPEIKLSKLDLVEKIVIAKSIRNRLKLADKQYTAIERIELREKFNRELNIYK